MFAGALIILLDQIIHRDLPVTLAADVRREPSTRRSAPRRTEAVKIKCCIFFHTLLFVPAVWFLFCLFFSVFFYLNYCNIFHGGTQRSPDTWMKNQKLHFFFHFKKLNVPCLCRHDSWEGLQPARVNPSAGRSFSLVKWNTSGSTLLLEALKISHSYKINKWNWMGWIWIRCLWFSVAVMFILLPLCLGLSENWLIVRKEKKT